MNGLRLGVDVGGTFTDLALYSERTHQLKTIKVPTTPESISMGIGTAIDQVIDNGTTPEDIDLVIHGSTIGTNTLLERKGSETWLLCTKGLRGINDTLDSIPPQNPGYFPYTLKPKPLVPGRRVVEVDARIAFDGTEVKSLGQKQIDKIVSKLHDVNPESIAICLLFSFMNASHEEKLSAAIRARIPHAHVSLSSHVLPQVREFPRLITTIIDAYIAPRVKGYLSNLEILLRKKGIKAHPYIMHSSGGLQTLRGAKMNAVQIIESGPAAGIAFSSYMAKVLRRKNVITYDMGGTTAKAGLIVDGIPLVTSNFMAGGWPLGIRSVDLVEIGSGGGSIAWADAAKSLKVGPRSGGAYPGPACYGNGGDATVTDADLLLGYLNPNYFLGGEMDLDVGLARRAIGEVGDKLGLDPEETALGIKRVVDAKMAEAIRLVSTFRGHDPRDFSLIAFGGAGPVHGSRLARELNLPEVIIPTSPGIGSAIGLLSSDLKREFIQSKLCLLTDLPIDELRQTFDGLRERALGELREEGFADVDTIITYQLDLRYSGQGYDLTVDVPSRVLARKSANIEIRKIFDDVHEATYGHRAVSEPVEVVTYRLLTSIEFTKPDLPILVRGRPHAQAMKEKRQAYFESLGFVETPIYQRDLLCRNQIVDGPCIIEQPDSTTVVEPEQNAIVLPSGELIVSPDR